MNGPIRIIFGMYMGIDKKNKILFEGKISVLCERFTGSPRIYMPTPNIQALIVSRISAFIRTDEHG